MLARGLDVWQVRDGDPPAGRHRGLLSAGGRADGLLGRGHQPFARCRELVMPSRAISGRRRFAEFPVALEGLVHGDRVGLCVDDDSLAIRD